MNFRLSQQRISERGRWNSSMCEIQTKLNSIVVPRKSCFTILQQNFYQRNFSKKYLLEKLNNKFSLENFPNKRRRKPLDSPYFLYVYLKCRSSQFELKTFLLLFLSIQCFKIFGFLSGVFYGLRGWGIGQNVGGLGFQ